MACVLTIFAINFVERSMVSEYGARNHRDLQILKVGLEYAKRSFYFSGVKNWNDIPDDIQEQQSLDRFKRGLEITFRARKAHTRPLGRAADFILLTFLFQFL